MGLTYVRIHVAKDKGSPARAFRVLVDTGATYMMLPRRALEAVGVTPEDRVPVRLGDGRLMERALGSAFVRYGRRAAWTQVLFGERGDASVLGAPSLKELRLQVDARSRRLREVKVALLVSATPSQPSPELLERRLVPRHPELLDALDQVPVLVPEDREQVGDPLPAPERQASIC